MSAQRTMQHAHIIHKLLKWHWCANVSYVHSAVALHENGLSMRLQFSTVPAKHQITLLPAPHPIHTSLEAHIANV